MNPFYCKTAVTLLLINLVHGCSQERYEQSGNGRSPSAPTGSNPQSREDVLFHCPPQTDIRIEISPRGDTATIRTDLAEVSFFSTASRSIKKCRVASRKFTYVNAIRIAVIGDDERVYMIDPHTTASLFSFPIGGHAQGPPAVCGNLLCVPVGPWNRYTEPS